MCCCKQLEQYTLVSTCRAALLLFVFIDIQVDCHRAVGVDVFQEFAIKIFYHMFLKGEVITT